MLSTVDQELQVQANQAAIDFSLKGLGSLFLLNGAAATALLTQNSLPLKWPALLFAFGALWAVAAMGIAYVFCLMLVETFRVPAPKKSDTTIDGDAPWLDLPLKKSHRFLLLLNGFDDKISINQFSAWRIRLIVFCLGSAVMFLLGLLVSGLVLGCS